MKVNVNIITQYSRTATALNVNTYTSGVAAHVGRDWEAHAVVRIYDFPYTSLTGGETVSLKTLRGLFTVDAGADVALAIPCNATGESAISGLAPIIITQPNSGNVAPNATFYLSVIAISDGNITYQWYFKGGALSGQSGPNLVVPEATVDNQGTYYVTCTNSYGTTQSATVNVSVQAGVAQFGINLPTGQGNWWDIF